MFWAVLADVPPYRTKSRRPSRGWSLALRPATLKQECLAERRNIAPDSQGFRKGHDSLVLLPYTSGSWLTDFAKSYGVGLQREICFGIDVGGADQDMAEPGAGGMDVQLARTDWQAVGQSSLTRRVMVEIQHSRSVNDQLAPFGLLSISGLTNNISGSIRTARREFRSISANRNRNMDSSPSRSPAEAKRLRRTSKKSTGYAPDVARRASSGRA